ncbi:MAG TPA: alginate export family protein, partial [Phycisphaerales bacterium]|nr:alginate export family protein [Phycisphaerales bacterium]
TLSFLTLDQAGGNNVSLFQPELTLYGRLNIDGVHGFYARAQFTHRDFTEGDSFDGRGDRWIQPFADRYWYEFDLRRALDVYHHEQTDANLNVRAGRQFVDWASGLALSEALYAVRSTIEFDRRNRLELLVGITADHTADFDTSRLGYDAKTRRVYYGGLFSHTFDKGDEAFAYALRMTDHNSEDRSRIGGLSNVSFQREGVYLGIGAKGSLSDRWLYLVEGIYLTGDSASDPLLGPQTREDLNAWAGRLQFTYAVRDEQDTRFQIELLAASGDPDRRSASDTVGGNAPGTDDRGFASLGFAFTGVAFAPSLTNLVSLRAGAATFPFRSSDTFHDLQLGADLICSFKYNRDGAVDEPTTSDRYLGTEADVYANWRVTSDLALTARYGVFFPGSAIPEPDDVRHFVYLGVTLSF